MSSTESRYGSESPEAVAERLEEIRLALDWPRKKIAEAINLSSSGWSNIQSMKQNITVPQACELCRVAGVSMDFVYRGLLTGLTREMEAKILKARAARGKRRRIGSIRGNLVSKKGIGESL